MTTTAVVKHFDVFEQIDLRVLMRPVARGMNPFVLQAVKEASVGALSQQFPLRLIEQRMP